MRLHPSVLPSRALMAACVAFFALAPMAPLALARDPLARRNRHVILVSTDGLRAEEVFSGADDLLLSKAYGGISDTNAARAAYWRPSPAERRAILLPFLWGTVATHGQVWGNRDLNSPVRVANNRHFSYPGYNEFLTGIPDPAIDSNDKKLNANTNVLEWLHLQPGFKGRVAAVCNWDVLPWILNAPRAQFPVWSGFDTPPGTVPLAISPAHADLVQHGRTVWPGVLLDTFVSHAALVTLQRDQPRALYVSLGETDDWAHEGAYDRYLRAAHEFDRCLSRLWLACQSLPALKDNTTLVVTTDHGRGPGPVAWKNHGAEIAASASMWVAILGPDTPPLGERSNTPLALQAQVAATVAAAVGHDFNAFSPRSAPPLPGVFKP